MYQVTNDLKPSPNKVTVETIHRFKGMEVPVVILTNLEGMFSGTAQTLLYVGITRAQGRLIGLEKADVLGKSGLG